MTRDSVSLSCANTPHPSCFSESKWYIISDSITNLVRILKIKWYSSILQLIYKKSPREVWWIWNEYYSVAISQIKGRGKWIFGWRNFLFEKIGIKYILNKILKENSWTLLWIKKIFRFFIFTWKQMVSSKRLLSPTLSEGTRESI